MRITAIVLFLISFFLNPAKGQAQNNLARGIVFNDKNANNKLDEGEKGLADIAVSNGEEVVLTDNEGRYELPVDDDAILFVVKPAGYKVLVNENQLPQFYYIHKPEGSPELKYGGVKATGPLPQAINFGLRKSAENENFDILIFGDPQPYTKREVDYFDRDIVNELATVKGYEFGITLGDIVGNDLDLFDPYIKSVSRIGIPWFNVYGNHDMNFDAEQDVYADETFEDTYGPATYAFNEGKVHFIILDDVIYPRKDGKRGYIGGLTDQQLTFIENDLAHVPEDNLIVIAAHIPLYLPYGNSSGRFREESVRQLFSLLEEFPNTLSLSAHTHRQGLYFVDSTQGWKGETPHLHFNVGTTSGDWWSGKLDENNIPSTTMRDGTPNGYVKIHFNGNQFRFNYKVARSDTSHKMNIWSTKVVPQNGGYRGQIFVNFFLGSEKTQIEYQVDNREWRLMRSTDSVDPTYATNTFSWDTLGTVINGYRPSNPVESTHLWYASLPNNIPVGIHNVRVRVTDMFGREFMDKFTYKVVQ